MCILVRLPLRFWFSPISALYSGLCVKWAECVLEEFFAQGDDERAQGIEISPMCDRYTTKRGQSQVGAAIVPFLCDCSYTLSGWVSVVHRSSCNDSLV